MGDRICIMRDGRVEQCGRPLEVYARPRNTFVAQFLASPAMNLLPARLEARDAGLAITAGPVEGALPAREAALHAAARGRALTLGLRAEDILTEARPGTLPFGGTVTMLEALGPENLITVESAGHTLSARVDRHFLPRPGSAVTLHADMGQMHLFDAATGAALGREG